jgi:hypothetical protein
MCLRDTVVLIITPVYYVDIRPNDYYFNVGTMAVHKDLTHC